MNWSNRNRILGGIYGQPIVVTNLTLYMISALVLVKAPSGHPDVHTLWSVAAPMAFMAAAYAVMMLRGPFDASTAKTGNAA